MSNKNINPSKPLKTSEIFDMTSIQAKIYLFAFVLIFSSCSHSPLNYQIKSNDFEHSDVPSAPFDLSYFWKNQIHFYSFDFHTSKVLHSYDKKGNLEFMLDLKPLIREVDASMYCANIINPDTILILAHSNNIYLTDKSGFVKKIFSLTHLTSKGLTIVPSCYLEGNNLTFSLHNKKGFSSPTNLDSLNKWLHHLPIMASLNLKNGVLTLKGDKIIPRFLNDDETDPEGINIFPYNRGYIYWSVFNDSIYKLSEHGEIEDVKKIHCQNDKQLHLNHIKLKDSRSGKINTTEAYLSGTYIAKMVYVPSVNYFVSLVREPQVNKKHFPIHLLVLNEKFETIEELSFAEGVYSPSMLAGENGVYLRRIDPDPKIHRYDYIEFN